MLLKFQAQFFFSFPVGHILRMHNRWVLEAVWPFDIFFFLCHLVIVPNSDVDYLIFDPFCSHFPCAFVYARETLCL